MSLQRFVTLLTFSFSSEPAFSNEDLFIKHLATLPLAFNCIKRKLEERKNKQMIKSPYPFLTTHTDRWPKPGNFILKVSKVCSLNIWPHCPWLSTAYRENWRKEKTNKQMIKLPYPSHTTYRGRAQQFHPERLPQGATCISRQISSS